MEIQELNLIVATIGVFIAFCTLVIAYYTKIHIKRKKDKEQKREEIYKPLLSEIDDLIEKVKNKERFTPSILKKVEGKISSNIYERLQKISQETNNYYELLKQNKDFLRFKNYFYLTYHLPDLKREYHSLGMGSLEFELYGVIVTPILDGESITLAWIRDNNREFFKRLLKCPSYEKLDELLKWLSEKNPYVQYVEEAQQNLLQSAENLKIELKKF